MILFGLFSSATFPTFMTFTVAFFSSPVAMPTSPMSFGRCGFRSTEVSRWGT
jgi:hypothetical protein